MRLARRTEERKENLGYYLGMRGNEGKGREIVWPPFRVSLYLGGPRVLKRKGGYLAGLLCKVERERVTFCS